jgi:hypothetical protein
MPALPHHRSPCTSEGCIFRSPLSSGRKSLGITFSKSGGRSAPSSGLGPALSSRTFNTCRRPLSKRASSQNEIGSGAPSAEVVEFAHVEMRVRVVLEGAPDDWLGTEVWRDGVDNRCRREFALQGVPPVVADGNLNSVSDSYLGSILYTSQTGQTFMK